MNISLLIGTCDSYLEFLPNCIKLADKYFEPNVKRVISGESQSHSYNGYDFTLCKSNLWGERILYSLNSIDTKYVFFILEDYYLCQKLSSDYISWLVKFMDRESAKKIMLSCMPENIGYTYSRTIDTIKQMTNRCDYLTSIQPSIWNVDHLKSILKPHYSPWDFEITGSNLLKFHENDHYAVKLDEPIYFNFVRKGKYLSPGASEFLISENLLT